LRVLTKTKCELEHIPCITVFIPCGKLIAPSSLELRPTETLWLFSREELDISTILPRQETLGRCPQGIT
jgi:hypothetical protein